MPSPNSSSWLQPNIRTQRVWLTYIPVTLYFIIQQQMKKLDQFILKSFLGPFFGILMVVIFILMLQFLWLYIDELVGKGLGFKIILEFLGWGSATMLPLSLPLATLLASVMTVGQMAENNELIAMKSAGISLVRVLTPLIISAGVISILAFFAVTWFLSHTTRFTHSATTSERQRRKSTFLPELSTTESTDMS